MKIHRLEVIFLSYQLLPLTEDSGAESEVRTVVNNTSHRFECSSIDEFVIVLDLGKSNLNYKGEVRHE